MHVRPIFRLQPLALHLLTHDEYTRFVVSAHVHATAAITITYNQCMQAAQRKSHYVPTRTNLDELNSIQYPTVYRKLPHVESSPDTVHIGPLFETDDNKILDNCLFGALAVVLPPKNELGGV